MLCLTPLVSAGVMCSSRSSISSNYSRSSNNNYDKSSSSSFSRATTAARWMEEQISIPLQNFGDALSECAPLDTRLCSSRSSSSSSYSRSSSNNYGKSSSNSFNRATEAARWMEEQVGKDSSGWLREARGSSSRELGVGQVAEAAVALCAVNNSESECCELLYLSELRVVLCKFSGRTKKERVGASSQSERATTFTRRLRFL
ncbi:hypothetical protein Taro_048218 [Colocasia esculenta]|uniref:Uncharacterized protein n=1 Tax=Colocasia esculenta TaxID=4460 RepID=A0A843X695_COLES|nr:hypothetical protein [Colocasia esculenta]